MNIERIGKYITVILVLVCLGVMQTACGLLSDEGAEPGQPMDNQQPDEVEAQPEESEGATQDEGDSTVDEQSENPVEPAFGADTLPCPAKDATLFLSFDHTLTVNYAETSITHMLHQGWLALTVTDANGAIVSQGSPALTYSMEGRMSDECTLTAEGTMMPSAHGNCEAGMVSLFIEENWMALEGEMECIDSDGNVVRMPFNAPAMGLQKHSGQNGAGEIFYLVEGSEGYATMRPFAEGDGYHTWTLYVDEIPPVPLVPED